METPPVVLHMNMRGRRVTHIERALLGMPGVFGVTVKRRTGTVVVRGGMHMDAEMLRRRLEYAMGTPVRVLDYGGRPESHAVQQYAPPPMQMQYYAPPAGYPYQYHQYPPQGAYPYQQPAAYAYQPQPAPYYGYGQGQYGGPPSVFDDTIPGNACTIM